MKFRLFNQGDGNYIYDPMRMLGLEDFHDLRSEVGVSAGILTQASSLEIYSWLDSNQNNRLLHFDAEQPNRFISMPNFSRNQLLTTFGPLNCFSLKDVAQQITVLSICPFTVEFANKMNGGPKYVPTFWPTKMIDKKKITWEKREFDVMYSGGIFPFVKNDLDIIQKISNVKIAIVSNSPVNIVTHRNITYEEKMQVVENSRITIVHNQLHFNKIDCTLNSENLGGLQGFDLFENLVEEINSNDELNRNVGMKFLRKFYGAKNLDEYVLPQLKTRLFEAAFGGSLILCREDKWNLANHWFKNGESMVLFNESNLSSTVKNILQNPDYFEKIAQNAREIAESNYSFSNWNTLMSNYL